MDPAPAPHLPGPTLDALIRRSADGDRSAFGELFRVARGPVYSLARHILRDGALAEEVTLDVFLELWRSAADVASDGESVTRWLLTTTRRRAVGRRRPGSIGAEKSTTHVDAAPALSAALSGLPPVQRRAIELAYFPGLSQHEIAERLNEPLGTIKTQIRTGMRKMRNELQTTGGRR